MIEGNESSEVSTEFKRRLPAMIVYLHPFRLVESKDLEPWEISIEQVNKASWDYVKLHEVAGGIDVGLPAPFHMIVGRDGALVLPPIPSLRSDQHAVEFFNRCLAAFLLGGVYCASVGLDNLEFGSVIDWKYIRSAGGGDANRFHQLIRMRTASPFEAILLEHPPTLCFDALRTAARDGFALLKLAPGLSGEFLLKGVSGIARRDWGVGLANLWITIEQLTEVLWRREVIEPVKADKDQISGRHDQFKDTRTWTASNRHEYLLLKGVISKQILRQLCVARKARNDLSHRGDHPGDVAANAAYQATLALLQCVVGDVPIPLASLNLTDHSLSDPFKPRDRGPLNPTYWMEIPKLPGEADLEREEAEEQCD